MNVSIFNCQRTRKINLPLLKQIGEALLGELGIQKAELEINLVAAGAMTRLNEKFLHHAGSTDVITFDYRNTEFQVRGEIFICVDEAVLQARRFRTGWPLEIVRYLIHGVLHLLGHDDAHAVKRRKMKREENRLLRKISRQFSLARVTCQTRLGA